MQLKDEPMHFGVWKYHSGLELQYLHLLHLWLPITRQLCCILVIHLSYIFSSTKEHFIDVTYG